MELDLDMTEIALLALLVSFGAGHLDSFIKYISDHPNITKERVLNDLNMISIKLRLAALTEILDDSGAPCPN